MADQIPDSVKSRAAFALAASKIDRDARLSDLTDAEIDALIAATRAAPPAVDAVPAGEVGDLADERLQNAIFAAIQWCDGGVVISIENFRAALSHGEVSDMVWLGGQHRLSLSHYSPMYGDDDDQSIEWRVMRESGPINDREWDIVGRGATPYEAVAAARAALSHGEGRK